MRRFPSGVFAGFLLVLAWAWPVAAQSIRVVTWHSDDFPVPAANAGTNDPDVRRLRQMAGVLRPYNADVILLEGLADRQTGQKLAGFLKPATYTLASFNVFRGGTSNQAVAPSMAILTRRTPLSARAVDWRTSGQIDTAGGFNFVSVPIGSNALCFYVAQFVDAPAGATNARVAQANYRKRELAAQYLLHHSRWIEGSLTNPLAAFLFTGNLGAGQAATDATASLVGQAGFMRAAPLPGGAAGMLSDRAWFARNASFNGAPQLGTPRGFGYGPVLTELYFKAPTAPITPVAPVATPVATVAPPVVASTPTVAPAPAPAPAPAVAPAPAPAPVSAAAAPGAATAAGRKIGPFVDGILQKYPIDERWLWLGVPVLGAVLLLLVVLLPYRWLAARRQSRALALRRSRNAVVVDFAPADAELEGGPAVAGALPAGGEDAWDDRARKAAVVREGLMPQLVRLMREKIFQRLSSQRAHLLDSHLNGTMAVLELEERLEKIQSQFATRLAAREQRIAELEAELAAKENIIRELIKAQARLAGRASNDV